mgnify:CR=1 FL=1
MLEQELGAVDGSGLASDHEGGAFAGRRVGGGFRLEEQRGASLVVGDAGVHEGRPVGLVGVGAGVEELAHARVVPVGGREEEGGHAGVVLDVGGGGAARKQEARGAEGSGGAGGHEGRELGLARGGP